jgi:hypothetical protein
VTSTAELTILAVVVGIRIVLSWSLSKEIIRHADIKSSGKVATALQMADETTHKETGSKDRSTITEA